MRTEEIIRAVERHGAELYIDGNQLKGRNTSKLPIKLKEVISANVQKIVKTMAAPPMPLLTITGELIIPLDCHPKYRWWQRGQSIYETLRELNAPEDVIARYVDPNYRDGNSIH